MQSKEVERCLTSTLLLAIHCLCKVSQTFVYPGPRGWHSGMDEFVNQVDACELRILRGHRCHQQCTTLKRGRLRIGKISDCNWCARLAKPFGDKLHCRIKCVGICRCSFLVAGKTEKIERRFGQIVVIGQRECRRHSPKPR